MEVGVKVVWVHAIISAPLVSCLVFCPKLARKVLVPLANDWQDLFSSSMFGTGGFFEPLRHTPKSRYLSRLHQSPEWQREAETIEGFHAACPPKIPKTVPNQ